MAGRLLFIIVMYLFPEGKAQALLPPTLTVNPQVITETDSVTLNCQTPSYVPECYFHTVEGEPAKTFSCLQTLTGTELLNISHQSSPAVVKVTCFYLVMSSSPKSEASSIIIRTSRPPKLIVNPLMINETDSVTLNCQAPPSAAVSQCYFFILSGGNIRDSCLQTLTGTELLTISHQSLPAVVEVMCFYNVKLGGINYPSPQSDTSSITIHSQKPWLSVQHFLGEHVVFACSLPGSANHDTRCNLYFGEAQRSFTTNIWREKSKKTRQWFCQFTVTIDDLLSRLGLVQQCDASCDYSLGSEPNSLSPRSDAYSLKDIVEKESGLIEAVPTFVRTTEVFEAESTKPTSTVTTGLTVPTLSASPMTQGWSTTGRPTNTGSFISTSLTPVKPASVTAEVEPPLKESKPTFPLITETLIWKLVVAAAAFGVSVGVLLGLALLCNKRKTERCYATRTQTNVTGDFLCMTNLDSGGLLPESNGEAYSVITAVPGADYSSGSEKLIRQEPQNEDSDIYHMYSTISEKPPPSALNDMGMVYSTVQLH